MKSLYKIQFLYFLPPVMIFFLLSCSCTGPSGRFRKAPVQWDKKPPAEILDDLKRDQELIRELTAHFSLSVEPPLKGKFSNLQGILFFKRGKGGNAVRIKALAPFGRLMFDMVRKENRIEIFVPSRGTLYRGRVTERKPGASGALGDPLEGVFESFSDMAVPRGAKLNFTDKMVTLPLTEGILKLDRESGLLKESYWKGRITSYGRYEHMPNLPPIPTFIQLKSSDGAQTAQCTLSQVCLNCSTGDVFNLGIYKPRFVKDINELEQLGVLSR